MMQARYLAFWYRQDAHDPHAYKYQREAQVGVLAFALPIQRFTLNDHGQLDTRKKLEAPPQKRVQKHKGKVTEEPVPVHIPEYQYQRYPHQRNGQWLQPKLAVFLGKVKGKRCGKIKALLYRKAPALGNTGKLKLIKKSDLRM